MKAPLLEEVIKYHEENNLILSMPGNKCGKAFLNDDLGIKFVSNMGKYDITEVEPLDNLHCPEGVIKEAQELLAKTYNAKKAYFLVNGTTSGNLASIFSAFNEGDEVIVERNCHKSIYNGLVLRKLKVNYIDPVIDEENGIFLPPNKENIYKAIEKSSNPKGIILTYPNYFGITYDIEEILRDLKKRGLKTIIDCAHGAHFVANKRLPRSITSLGDYVILSAHKTLPALTQGSYLVTNVENEFLEFYIKAFMTTSPSYLIMSSLDYSRYYLDEYSKDEYDTLIDLAEEYKNKINKLKKVKILSKGDLINDKYYEYDIDLSRYLVVLPHGHSGHKLLEYFRTKKIQCEMSFSRGVVLILSPVNKEKDFDLIYKSIEELDLNLIKCSKDILYSTSIPEKVLEPFEVFSKECKLVKVDESINKISKNFIIPYPPGIPLVCPGEKISENDIEIIKDYIRNNKDIIGVEKEKIMII